MINLQNHKTNILEILNCVSEFYIDNTHHEILEKITYIDSNDSHWFEVNGIEYGVSTDDFDDPITIYNCSISESDGDCNSYPVSEEWVDQNTALAEVLVASSLFVSEYFARK